MTTDKHWKVKVLAFTHDPPEKPLILLRGKGHEAGTVARLREYFNRQLDPSREELDALQDCVKKGDWWASAADRPSLPKGLVGGVTFTQNPRLIHPLSGNPIDLKSLQMDIPVEAVEAVSLDHLESLIVEENGRVDWKKTFLSLWRFGPCRPAKDLGSFWGQLPADTRSPDHTIWEHLSLTSAFAGALAADANEEPALFLMSFGPVQGFIAQARSVSDLWAGSHFLSRMVWAALEEVCDRYGPDAVLFPNLHGVAMVDLWLYGVLGEPYMHLWSSPQEKSGEPEWKTRETDANPLFAAALPNRFVALVPASAARDLAGEIENKVRRWTREKAGEALRELAERAGVDHEDDAARQLERQLKDFPEISWAVVPWRLGGKESLDDGALRELLKLMGAAPHYMPEDVERMLKSDLKLNGISFYQPNPGVAYPGLYELLERIHSAAKSVRTFSGGIEEGYRCTLCGEREWLAHRRDGDDAVSGIFTPPGQRKGTLWTLLRDKNPSLAKEGEHLCGWCALKRAWPRLFVQEIKERAGMGKEPGRFVLSTHAVAVSTSLWRWAQTQPGNGFLNPEGTQALSALVKKLEGLVKDHSEARPVVLPAKLYGKLRHMGLPQETIEAIKRVPALLDAVEGDDARQKALRAFKDGFGVMPETYYALVLMDGDHMGKWLSAGGERPTLGQRFHENTRAELKRYDVLKDYLDTPRPASPAWHQAISGALNAFALHVSRRIVEDLFMGKLIYAGGDDLLAMVAVHDLPAMMFALRCAFSGQLPAGMDDDSFWRKLETTPGLLKFGRGYALVQGAGRRELFRLMGEKATASMGAVIAHHQAPLARVLAQLRAAERKAKNEGGRDAFCLSVCKRSGGTAHLVGRWNVAQGWRGSDMGLLLDLRNLIARDVSRRVAYELAEVFQNAPPRAEALAAIMAYQFRRKAKGKEPEAEDLARDLAARAVSMAQQRASESGESLSPNSWLRDLVLTAEFLAREGRVSPETSTVEENR